MPIENRLIYTANAANNRDAEAHFRRRLHQLRHLQASPEFPSSSMVIWEEFSRVNR